MQEWTDEELARLPVRDGVRQRGQAPTRLETFCDAAFAFAVTILVISGGSVPGSYQELIAALKDAPAFAAGFAAIAAFWSAHRQWGQRYGLEDRPAVLLSLAMVFVMLVYVYPLKMVFAALAAWASGGALPATFTIRTLAELRGLFIIYGLGFAAQSALMALLYAHTLRVPLLRLDAGERLRTRHKVVSWLVSLGTGLLSALWAGVMPDRLGVFAGFVYALLAVIMPIVATRQARQAQRLAGGG